MDVRAVNVPRVSSRRDALEETERKRGEKFSRGGRGALSLREKGTQ